MTLSATVLARRRQVPALAAVALLAWAGVPAGGGPAVADGGDAERGRLLYRIHCASCHGEAGRGDGPVAKELRASPVDLTRIAARNGGDFPADRVHRTIDGRQTVRAHGPRTMPVWGVSFQELGRDSDQEAEVRAKIEALVAYLRTIQETATEDR